MIKVQDRFHKNLNKNTLICLLSFKLNSTLMQTKIIIKNVKRHFWLAYQQLYWKLHRQL